MCGLLDDPRITGLIGGVIGEDFNYASGDGNYYSGDTNWHPDGGWKQLFAVKVAFYLDPLTEDTGCLRVIPGSQRPDHWIHTEGVDPNKSEELFGLAPRDFPGCITQESNPGDVVIFNHDLFHASFGGGTRRQMFTMNCTRHTTTPEDMELQHKYVSIHSPGGYKVNTGAGMYFPTMLDTADETRMVHLKQCAEIHDELFPEFARK
jgi:ectoine hydroxylase-related dioxygenase (phytanoyl-CoA dioxygenase family)